jgi:hypothetical protein
VYTYGVCKGESETLCNLTTHGPMLLTRYISRLEDLGRKNRIITSATTRIRHAQPDLQRMAWVGAKHSALTWYNSYRMCAACKCEVCEGSLRCTHTTHLGPAQSPSDHWRLWSNVRSDILSEKRADPGLTWCHVPLLSKCAV